MDHTQQEEGSCFALPTPTDTPYRTPPRSRSRQSRRHGSISPGISSSPVSFPPNGEISPRKGHDKMNSATDENISPLDPRRFTPSLHASLVSEILSLRREVEGKTNDIEHLEDDLATTRNENESLHETLASTTKDARSLRRQIQLLEGGAVSALSGLSEERDEAISDSAELRKRLDLSLKKIKSQEESIERIQTLWTRDRGNWETETRALETKVHIVEGRLKVVLSEIANSHMVNGHTSYHDTNHHGSPKKMHLRNGSAASVRSMGFTARRRDSEASYGTQEADLHGHRLSAMMLASGNATCLADELAFDEGEEDQLDQNGGHEEQVSSDELPEERPMSIQSRPLDLKARKVLGIGPDNQLPVVAENGQRRQSVDTAGRTDLISKIQALYEVQYVDAGVQYSPPPSPKLSSTTCSSKATEDDEKTVDYKDALSRQGSDAASRSTDTTECPITPFKAAGTMISSSCQTLSELPSPPWTPLSARSPTVDNASASPLPEYSMTSAATQTDTTVEVDDSNINKFSVMRVPIIAIHPPASRPTSPTGTVVLPPQTKNACCQVDVQTLFAYTSSSMQTEEIRVDARIARLPQKLLPSRRPSLPDENAPFRKLSALQPANPLPNSSRRRLQQPGPIKPASSRRRVLEPTADLTVLSRTPEVDTPIGSPTENLPRTSESSVSVAVDESHAKEDVTNSEPERFDEDDIFSRPTAKFTLKAGKLVSKDVPEIDYQDIFDKIDAEANEPESPSVDYPATDLPTLPSHRGLRGVVPPPRSLERKQRTMRSNSSKQFDIRKAALISSGTAAHQSSRDRSPSAPVNPPPFPVPTRHSSRNPPLSVSEGAQSPTPNSRSPRKRNGKVRKPVLRKVRSATSVPPTSASGQPRSPSPPLPSLRYDAMYDPGLPLPNDLTSTPSMDFPTSFRRRSPIPEDSHSRTGSGRTVLQQTSVVDAIAQTMVGEWMFKYIRRRKSFGVPEPKGQDWDLTRNGDELSANITNSGVRHKRWVWLAPYERAVMWSSKQPTSGSALMGKSGRKLEIQSVLDVRDDNPLPKGSATGPHFNRSILILTPERALKFTATSQERHYVWLTALSFLSHSPLGLGDLTALPSVPPQEHMAPRPFGGSLRRNPIRDSIRVAKGRDPRAGRAGQRSFTTDGVIPQLPVDREILYHSHEPLYQPISDAADPPTVPRYHSSRHRSNTGPRVPPPSSRTISNNYSYNSGSAQFPPSTYSMTTATASDVYTPSLHHSHPTGFPSAKSSFSRRGSEASVSIAASNPAGYFDHSHHHTAPTMRMEAFIGEEGEKRPRGSYRTRKGRKKDLGYWGVGERPVPPMTMPGVDLPHQVIGPRTSSRSAMAMQGPYPGLMTVDPVAIMGEDGFEGKRGLARETEAPAFEGPGLVGPNHFRGF